MDGGKQRRSSNWRIVVRDVGGLQLLLAVGMLISAAVSLLYWELYNALSLGLAAGITAALGSAAYRNCRDANDPKQHHAMVIAGAGWLVSGLTGALPLLFAAYLTPPEEMERLIPVGETYESSLLFFRNYLHAFFESMSAYTTTGLTMAVHEPSIGHGLLFYRSLAQWIGGAGVVVLSLAIIPRPRAVGLELYQSESTGLKLRPSVVGTARAIWKVYSGVTLLSFAYLAVATFIILPDYGFANTIFDAINHAMTGQSTGGFSTLDDSIAGYKSYAMDLVHIPPMILGAISIPLYYSFLRERDAGVFWRDLQFRTMVLLFIFGSPLLVLLLLDDRAVGDPVREGVFQFISSVTTTGWQTSNIADWNSSAVVMMVGGAMLCGGAAGATVGGLKLIRPYILLRAADWRMRKVMLPGEAVLPFTLGDRKLSTHEMQREVTDAAVFTFLFLIILAMSVTLVANQMGPNFTLADAIFEAVSAQSTVGLSAGITDPSMPVSIEITFILQMWLGRLEIFPVLILFRAIYVWNRRAH